VENALAGADSGDHLRFPFPLNVLVHVLLREEGRVSAMHYGVFEHDGESIVEAQERSTDLLLARLPPPPARLLEVGIGLGTTLARLIRRGYAADGLTPDPGQVSFARRRFGDAIPVVEAAFETFESDDPSPNPYDAVLFQESSQYIDTDALFRRARALTRPGGALLAIDEFALRPVDLPAPLHRLDHFLAVANREGFRLEEDLDLSRQAAPTIAYFLERIPRHRTAIERELEVDGASIDALLTSGERYRDLYRSGAYGYRLLRFSAGNRSV
jgi:SAM-dependent methyltransferase